MLILNKRSCFADSFEKVKMPQKTTQSVRPPLATYSILCSTCVTYGTSCHAMGHQLLPTHPLPRVLRI